MKRSESELATQRADFFNAIGQERPVELAAPAAEFGSEVGRLRVTVWTVKSAPQLQAATRLCSIPPMTQEEGPVHAGSAVALREITADTVREITSLDVSVKQQGYLASNAVSIAEAHFNPGAWFRAIYADDTAIGFVMLFNPTLRDALPRPGIEDSEVALWRFMIDQRYQGKGFGHKALDLICAIARSRPGIDRLIASCVPGPDGPEEFYLKYGFAKTGRLRSQDREIEISFAL